MKLALTNVACERYSLDNLRTRVLRASSAESDVIMYVSRIACVLVRALGIGGFTFPVSANSECKFNSVVVLTHRSPYMVSESFCCFCYFFFFLNFCHFQRTIKRCDL